MRSVINERLTQGPTTHILTLTANPLRDMVMTHTHAKGQRQRSLDSNDSGKGQTDGADCITFIANAVGKYKITFIVKSTYLVFS